MVVVALRHRWLAPLQRPTWAGFIAALRADLPAWIIATAIGLVVLAVLGINGWSRTPDGWVSGGWNWSDLLVHVAIGSSISAGNFPPEVPYFAGVPLTYHWFADFHGAIASTVAGLDIIPVYFASSALFASVLALVVWALARRLTGDRRVATIATIFVVAGGGLGWIRLIGDMLAGAGDPLSLVSRLSYDNTWADGWPYFKIASIFGTGFLPHRATTLGLPGLVTAVLLVVQCLGRRPLGVLLAGVLAALLAPFQFFAFPATYLIVFLYVVTSGAWRGANGRARRRAVPGAGHPGDPVHRLGRAAPERCRGVPVRGRVGRSPFRRWAGGGRVLLPDQPRHPVRPRDRRGIHRAEPAKSLVPRGLDGGAVRRAERGRRERGRVRHEQVLPDHVDRGRDPRRVADPALAAAVDRGRPASSAPCHRHSSRCGTCGRTWSRSAWRRRRPRVGSPPTRPRGPSS